MVKPMLMVMPMAMVQAVIEGFGDLELLGYMNALWKSNNGNDESFWEHEFNKHVSLAFLTGPRKRGEGVLILKRDFVCGG
jgi:hypothetical protein